MGDRPRQAVAGPDGGGAEPLPPRHGRRARLRHVPEPDGAQARVHARVRGDHLESPAPLPRDRQLDAARADRGVHVVPPVPGVQGRTPEAGGARGHGRRPEHPRVLDDVRHARDPLRAGARAHRDRAPDRRADPEGDPRAADVPRRRRRRLPPARPRRGDALRRRGAAAAARDADRLAARRRALHPRRAVDRAAPARQRQADRNARAAARPREHRARGRARRADDAERGLARRHGPGRGRARRACRRRGDCGHRREEQGVGHRSVPLAQAADRDPGAAHGGSRLVPRARREPAQPEGDRRRVPGRQVRHRHGRLGVRQVDARERDRPQDAREPAPPHAHEAGRARRASRGSRRSTR